MHESEKELAEVIGKLDSLVDGYLDGSISFDEFLRLYGYPVGEYALDGHESSAEGKAVLARFKDRLLVHEQITEKLLHKYPGLVTQKAEAANLLRAIASEFRATKT